MKKFILLLSVVLACLLAGCSILTADQLYQLPRRAQEDDHLQSAIDSSMTGLNYCAPLSGEHQQTVQMADLDGDGVQEYLVFAKGSSEKPLRILIFCRIGQTYSLMETIESTGSAFDLVEYVQMDKRAGVELVVGRQVSNEILRSVSVYSFSSGQAETLVSTNYSKYMVCDLDGDRLTELMVLRPGQSDTDNGVAELYGVENGVMERSNEVSMSASVDRLKRIISGTLHGGTPAVFVGSAVQESALITDVYAVVDGVFTNVSFSNESGTSVQTLRNYYVYADDIDNDGDVELPDLITMDPYQGQQEAAKQYLIRWYSMAADGSEIDKMFTYHNFVGGWYLELGQDLADGLSVVQEENTYRFYLQGEQLYSISVLTGSNREEQGTADGRFVLHRTETVVYAAKLESMNVSLTKEVLIAAFHMIRQDWKTGEM